ncbi:ferric reduction oxidase 2-like isoform X1 [Hevea brasiliensis]|uniref:ferric reduction oxidase 2-like isoform X1 n=1 Tax=Hevea brasiliensis TaxID=3981 RepID=UPI0025EEDFEC|nr:ferric reduction oxidase 2-like isoform X1 [Hevea brasiliensis]
MDSGSACNKESTDMVRTGMKIILMVVLVGYVMLWIVMPTNTYQQKWRPNMQIHINSTFFGLQGATLLVYFFPILFVAVLGCVYLHLGRRSNHCNFESNSRKHLLATWKNPMVVKGPLGIVSGIELAFLIMFVALLIWSLSTYLRNSFATITPQLTAESGERQWEAKMERAALSLGLVGNICLTFLFFPVARGSSVLPLFGLTSEGSIKYHIWLGHMVMAFFTAHGLCYIIYWAATNQISEMLKWAKAEISNVAGELSLLAGLGLWTTTFTRIRRKMFELFFYTHHLYILFMIFFLLHVSISFSCIMLPGFYLFLVDRFLRFLQSRQRVRVISTRILPCETLEINFSKSPGLSYNPTSVLFINVPSISKLQWHPFTITSNSNLEPGMLSVVIKSEGSWSKKLYQMLSSPSSIDHLEVSVEGPYGPSSTDFLRHDTLVMVSGGSGITPFISVIRELIFASTTYKCKTPQVILICSFKNSSDLTRLDLLLPISGTPSTISSIQLKIEAYVTREKEPSINNLKLLRTIWFKTHPTDAPVSAILGPKSWLWLGAIISSSFIIFLIIIGLITRYYIFPIDHNTWKVFSYSFRSFLNMLVICICIAMTASAAVFWNKKKNVREANQIQNIEGSTPSRSPGSRLYDAERELESLPHQSLVQATNVHYGERPDLKRILFDCKGSSIGVLVCGPKQMRQETAAICSSGLADNLHFESISFSW